MYMDASKTLVAQRLGEVMRHEFTHALHAADRAPLGQDHAAWVSEGLGVLYETTVDQPDAIVPGGDNPRYVVAQRAARRGSLIPLARLLAMSQAEFMSRPNITYPESGALLFYLRERNLLRKFYDAYKTTFDADPTGGVALQRATGQTLDELESAWKQWLLEREEKRRASDPNGGNSFFLGVRLRPTPGGLTIADVLEGGPAAAAGVRAGDVLLSINGKPVRDFSSIRPAIGAYAPGKTVSVKVRRKDDEMEFPLTLPEPARRPPPREQPAGTP
jgi:hypothetical protein